MCVSQEHIDKFCGILKDILNDELSSGNIIKQTYEGYPEGTTTIVLQKPFKRPIKKDFSGIEFKNVNDPHYWKAEYHDIENHLILICGFNGPQDLDWNY